MLCTRLKTFSSCNFLFVLSFCLQSNSTLTDISGPSFTLLIKEPLKCFIIDSINDEPLTHPFLDSLTQGGLSLVIGGALMRSAQFGVYDSVLSSLRKSHSSDHIEPVEKIFGVLDPYIVIAGFSGIPISIPIEISIHATRTRSL